MAAESLQAAVDSMPEGDPPLGAALAKVWPGLGKHCIRLWIADVDSCSRRIGEALEFIDSHGRGDESREALEGALWRVDAAREKLEAVFVLAFGVPSLRVHQGRVSFEPNPKRILAKLKELAKQHEEARELRLAAETLAGHPAVRLRNQLSHVLAPLESADPLCYVDCARVRDASAAWKGGPFYAKDALVGGDIGAEALWSHAVGAVADCFDLLVRSIELMADLVRASAVLPPPERVYRDAVSGKITLKDPRKRAA